MEKMKSLTLQGITFEVTDEQARNDIQTLSDTIEAITPVQSDLAQNDPTQPDYVKNRTHWEETTTVNKPLNITWDGNTGGLIGVVLYEGVKFLKVSDLVFTDEQIKTMSETLSNGDYTEYSEAWDAGIEEGMVIPRNDITVCWNIVVARVDGAIVELDGALSTFPEKGLYFLSSEGWAHVASLTSTEPVEQTKTVVHKLDKKYLPDGDTPIGATPIIYVVDNSGEETVCSCSVDINTAFNSCLSAPISVKIFNGREFREAYALNVNIGTPGKLTVGYKYDKLREEVSEFIVHDSEGVRIGKPV